MSSIKKNFLTTMLALIIVCLLGTCLVVFNNNNNTKTASAANYSYDGVVARGIDISYWQGTVNYSTVKSRGIDFVICRLSYGTSYDSTFATHINGCLAVGIDVGLYVFSTATTVAGAQSEANWAVSKLASLGFNSSTFAYPLYIDIENDSSSGIVVSNRSNATNTAMANAWDSIVESHGYMGGLYTGKSLYQNSFDRGSLACEKWIAYYTYTYSTTGYNHSWLASDGTDIGIWQYSSTGSYYEANDGSSYGVSSAGLDMNYCYKEYAGGGRWTSENGTYTISQGDSHVESSGWDNGNYVGNPFHTITNPNSGYATYAVQARFENTDATAMETQEYGTVKMGLCPFYLNSNNFILIYMYWAKDVNTTRMRSIEAEICVDGNFSATTIGWVHDVDAMSALWHNSNWSNGYWLHCDVSKTAVRIIINDLYIGTLQTDSYFDSLVGKGANAAFYSWWASTKVTDYGTWEVNYWGENNGAYSINVNDAVEGEWTQANFCDMSIFNDYASEQTYSVSAKFTVNAVKGTVQKIGFSPMYLDSNNYIMVFLKWDDSVSETKMCSVEFSGMEQGNAIYGTGYYTCWVHDQTNNAGLQTNIEAGSVYTIKCNLENDGMSVSVNGIPVCLPDATETKVSLTGFSGGLTGNTGRITLFSYNAGVTVSEITCTNASGDSGTTGGTTGGDSGTTGGDSGTTPITYTISFKRNGGSGSMSAITVTAGESKNLTANVFTKDGYVFKGWSTTKTGSVQYTDGQSITPTKNITLYAVWEATTVDDSGTTGDNTGSGSETSTAGGCMGSVSGASLLSLIAVGGVALFTKKLIKKED